MTRFAAVFATPAVLALAAAPAAAHDEAAIIQKRNQVREMARDALASLYEFAPHKCLEPAALTRRPR